MSSNFKKIIIGAVTLFGLVASTTFAASAGCSLCDGCPERVQSGACDPCACCHQPPCDLCGYELGVDLLVWKVCITDTALAIEENTNCDSFRNIAFIDHPYKPGIRVFFRKADTYCDPDCCSFGLYSSFTYFHTSKRGGVEGLALFGGFGGAVAGTRINGTDEITYHNWDILLEKIFCCGRCQTLTGFFGVDILTIDREYRIVDADNCDNNIIRDLDTWYVGLKAGANYDLWVFDCVKLWGRFSATLATGEYDDLVINDRTTSFAGNSYSRRNESDCIFGYHIQVGAEYETCFCDYLFRARLGYEFVQWHGWPSPASGSDNAGPGQAIVVNQRSTTLGFHGVLAGITLGF